MINRSAQENLKQALTREAAVALIGPRQVGKTTLALEIGETRPSLYLDLENTADREKLSAPEAFLNLHQDKLVILDEVHRVPDLFASLRGIIDAGRRAGNGIGRFLLLGSASIELMRQSETLAGRIEYIDLGPLHGLEIDDIGALWLRGGFPRSYLAADDATSLARRQNFIRTYLERDIPMFGPRIPAETLERLWTMLAHNQGCLLNAAQLARSLSVSTQSVLNYIGLLQDLLLIRRLRPWQANIGKRLVKSPKVYIRDSGLTHALLGIGDMSALLGHPVAGATWEGMVIESLLQAAPWRTTPYFYRTARGAEIDLVLDIPGQPAPWAVEIKSGSVPRTGKGFTVALDDIRPAKAFVVYNGDERYPKGQDVEAIGVVALATILRSLNN